MSKIELGEVAIEIRCTIRGKCIHVLEADSPPPFDVDSRFNGHDHAWAKMNLITTVQGWGFVNGESDPMSETMAETRTMTCGGDQLASGAINGSAGDSRSKSERGVLLGRANETMEFEEKIRRRS